MIDTHCHLTYDGLFEQVGQVVARARQAGVNRMITVGTTPDDALRAVTLTERFNGVFATVGVHPHYAAQWPDRMAVTESMRQLAALRTVVALGEMGLDRHYPDPPFEIQQRVLEWQLDVASDLIGLPVIIHNREATDETLSVLKASGIPGSRFVFHCFTGSDKELDEVLAFGAMVSVTGIVTFKNAATLAASAARVPSERLMIETDAPYLTPEPVRKMKTNEPGNVRYVAKFLAAHREVDVPTFVDSVDANAARFFDLPRS